MKPWQRLALGGTYGAAGAWVYLSRGSLPANRMRFTVGKKTNVEYRAALNGVMNTGEVFEDERAGKLRHPWAVCGFKTDASGTRNGYLQLFLEALKPFL